MLLTENIRDRIKYIGAMPKKIERLQYSQSMVDDNWVGEHPIAIYFLMP